MVLLWWFGGVWVGGGIGLLGTWESWLAEELRQTSVALGALKVPKPEIFQNRLSKVYIPPN